MREIITGEAGHQQGRELRQKNRDTAGDHQDEQKAPGEHLAGIFKPALAVFIVMLGENGNKRGRIHRADQHVEHHFGNDERGVVDIQCSGEAKCMSKNPVAQKAERVTDARGESEGPRRVEKDDPPSSGFVQAVKKFFEDRHRGAMGKNSCENNRKSV